MDSLGRGSLARSAQALAERLERLPVAALLVDAEGGIAGANAAARALLGERDGLFDLLGRLFAAHLPTHARLAPLIARVARGSNETAHEGGGALRLPRHSGRPPLEVLLVPCSDGRADAGSAGCCLLVVRDPERRGGDLAGPWAQLEGLFPAAVGARLRAWLGAR